MTINCNKPQHFVFMDRDGVINVELGEYTISVAQWRWADYALEGIKKLTDSNFAIIVVTNQSCIAKGIQTEAGLAQLHAFMLESIRKAGGDILRIYHCPHETADGCSCRKPEPGMFLKAARDYNISLPGTFMIGDSLRDMEAGRNAGCHTILIDSEHRADSRVTQFESGEFSADNLLTAADIVIRETLLKK